MDNHTDMIPPGSTIGILGGGQLGRMFSAVALRMGYKTVIYSDVDNAPAFETATSHIVGDYKDETKLREFAKKCDVITLEFENIPIETLEFLSNEDVLVRPNADVLKIAQYRVAEKQFFDKHNIPTARWKPVKNTTNLANMYQPHGILKLARHGYDGKGQYTISDNNPMPDFNEEAILEERIDFEKEISVIIARTDEGDLHYYPPIHNIHKYHILDTSTPATISQKACDRAIEIAEKVAESLNLIGMVAVEMFLRADDEIYVNEIAPRPHNSGHWTMDGANICQFELLLRTICNLPIPTLYITQKVIMRNLLGDEANDWDYYLKQENMKLHLYGKTEIRANRKMGHVNLIKPLSSSPKS
ncbi:MAG: 5-(carboxyamino)imidazole ribonucleotide synthase [Alphaproteobacteria bacterium]|nr:5-(carboxyamino)imidazole ribonucleotide synthase [Alphaproteobacteria bacterium]